MPAKSSRARRWLREGKAKIVYNDLGIFQIQLTKYAADEIQPIVVGIDPANCIQASLSNLLNLPCG